MARKRSGRGGPRHRGVTRTAGAELVSSSSGVRGHRLVAAPERSLADVERQVGLSAHLEARSSELEGLMKQLAEAFPGKSWLLQPLITVLEAAETCVEVKRRAEYQRDSDYWGMRSDLALYERAVVDDMKLAVRGRWDSISRVNRSGNPAFEIMQQVGLRSTKLSRSGDPAVNIGLIVGDQIGNEDGRKLSGVVDRLRSSALDDFSTARTTGNTKNVFVPILRVPGERDDVVGVIDGLDVPLVPPAELHFSLHTATTR